MAQDLGMTPAARAAAAALALVGFAGLATQTGASIGTSGSLPAALWAMLRFFTIIGNLVAMLLFAAIALGRPGAFTPRRVAGIAVIMGLIGVIYVTLLRHTEHPRGAAQVANMLLHYAVPALAALYWLAFAPKGYLRTDDPLRWALLPLAYLPYALLRGALDGRYAYPFIDVGQLGWMHVALNAMGITAGFLIAGFVLVWLDRRLAGP